MNSFRKALKPEAGFSLVELMIVVGIIGLLATLAVPRFQQFQAKARMAEAKNMLNHIFTLQEAYHLDSNTYRDVDLFGRLANGSLSCTPPAGALEIGFKISPCPQDNSGPVPRYGYQVTGSTRTEFLASAQTGAGDNNLVCQNVRATAHRFIINQNREAKGPIELTTQNPANCTTVN